MLQEGLYIEMHLVFYVTIIFVNVYKLPIFAPWA